MVWKVTYLGTKRGVKHEVIVDAPTSHVALRLAWDAFAARRVSQRYSAPLMEDYALYSVVEIKERITDDDGKSVPKGNTRN
jgi:hypothetical protein